MLIETPAEGSLDLSSTPAARYPNGVAPAGRDPTFGIPPKVLHVSPTRRPIGARTFELKFAPEYGPDREVQYVLGVSTGISGSTGALAAPRVAGNGCGLHDDPC